MAATVTAEGTVTAGGEPVVGATVKLWDPSVVGPKVYNDPLPGGSPSYSDTTDADGAWSISSVTAGLYWVSVDHGSTITWTLTSFEPAATVVTTTPGSGGSGGSWTGTLPLDFGSTNHSDVVYLFHSGANIYGWGVDDDTLVSFAPNGGGHWDFRRATSTPSGWDGTTLARIDDDGNLLANGGTSSAPGFGFLAQPGLGLYRQASGVIGATGHLRPHANATDDLGSTSLRWNALWAGAATLASAAIAGALSAGATTLGATTATSIEAPIGTITRNVGGFTSVVANTTINAGTALQLGGADINTGGGSPTLSNVAYLDRANAFTNNQTVTKTTEQLRVRYDASNYLAVTVGSSGDTALALKNTSATLTLSGIFAATSIQGTPIGTATRAAGAFTTVDANSTIHATGAISGDASVAAGTTLSAGTSASVGTSAAVGTSLTVGTFADVTGPLGLGVTHDATKGKLYLLDSTGQQFRFGYDATHYGQLLVDNGGNVTFDAPQNSITLQPGTASGYFGGVVYPYSTLATDLGAYNRKSRVLYAGELNVDVLVAQSVLATIGGRIMVCPTSRLFGALLQGATTLYLDNYAGTFAAGDHVYLADAPGGLAQFEFVTLGTKSGPTTDPTTGRAYYTFTGCTRDANAHTTIPGPTVTPVGATGATSYSYYLVVTYAAGDSVASVVTTITNGNATLNGTNYNTISWTAREGATGYKVLRGGTSGTVKLATVGSGTLSVNDQGGALSSHTAGTLRRGNSWADGDTTANTGGSVSSGGLIDLTSTVGYVAAGGGAVTTNGPAITIYSRTGTAYNAVKPTVNIGSLKNFADIGSNDYHGIAFGNDLTLTPTTGFRGLVADANNGSLRLFSTDLKMYGGLGSTQTGDWRASDGRLLVGTNVAAVATTTLGVFTAAATWGSDTFSAGSVLVGPGSGPNLLWDATQMKLRSAQTVWGLWDANGVVVGQVGSGLPNTFVSPTAVALRLNTTAYITLDSNSGTPFVQVGQTGAGQTNVLIQAGAISLRNNVTERIGLTSAGTLTIKDSGGNAVFTFDTSAGAEFTKPLTIGSAGGIYQGSAGTFASPNTGLKVFQSSSDGQIEFWSGGVRSLAITPSTFIFNGIGQGVSWKDYTGSITTGDLLSLQFGSRSGGSSRQIVRVRSMADASNWPVAHVQIGAFSPSSTNTANVYCVASGSTAYNHMGGANFQGLIVENAAWSGNGPTSGYLVDVSGKAVVRTALMVGDTAAVSSGCALDVRNGNITLPNTFAYNSNDTGGTQRRLLTVDSSNMVHVGGGSTFSSNGHLIFDVNGTEAARFDTSRNLTLTRNATLSGDGTNPYKLMFNRGDNLSAMGFAFDTNNTRTRLYLIDTSAAYTAAYFDNTGAYFAPSDARLKTNLVGATDADEAGIAARLAALPVSFYEHKSAPGEKRLSTTAQDWQTLATALGLDADGTAINHTDWLAVLTAGFKTLARRLTVAEAKVAQLLNPGGGPLGAPGR